MPIKVKPFHLDEERPPSFRIYMSHCIRGKNGAKATRADMDKNNNQAKQVAESLRSYFLDWHRMDGLVEIDLYVPGEHDEFVINAYNRGYITVDQILEVDGDIIDTCDMVLVNGNYVSEGIAWEIDHAAKQDIPVFQFNRLNKTVIQNVYDTILFISANKLAGGGK